MSRATRFAARDPGPAARVAGFMAHLRGNGLRLGVAETGTAMEALAVLPAADAANVRLALRAVCTGCADEAARFDDLFDAYWLNGGRVRARAAGAAPKRQGQTGRGGRTGAAWDEQRSGTGLPEAPDAGDGAAEEGGTGRLVASGRRVSARTDLRRLVAPEDVAEAEAVARRLGAALRDRRSRRRRPAASGGTLDFRRLARLAMARGGEPVELPRRRRPERPVRIAALVDVSGSMQVYARVFLAFLSGLMRADRHAEAFVFHTRLVPVTGALREPDPLTAMARLSLLAEGFGGGSRIGAALSSFAAGPAKRCIGGRSVVLILSDGYDTGAPDDLAAALAAIRRRGARIVWLNPLKGWRDYAPVAAGMAAALPHLDHFAACATLADMAALETEFARL